MAVTSPHPRIVSLLNHKGGVGKTSTVAGLAHEAARTGMRVLVIDMDKQASLTIRLGVPIEGADAPEYNVNDAIATAEKGVAKDVAIASPWENIDIIPSSLDLAAQEANMSMGATRMLALALDDEEFLSQYGLVLIDCAPTLSMLASMALNASDEVLLVTEAEALSLQGIRQTIKSIRHLDPDYRISGMIINKFRGTKEHNGRLEEIRNDELLAPLLWEPLIPQRTIIAEAAGDALPLSAYPRRGGEQICEIYAQLLTKLLNDGGE